MDAGVNENLYTNRIKVNGELIKADSFAPSTPTSVPSDKFVICRDINGKPVALYGQDSWDLNPMKLSATRIQKLHFVKDRKRKKITVEQEQLADEHRYLVFCLMYYIDSGKIGRLAASTLISYHGIIRQAVAFCLSLSENELVGVLTLKELFSNKTYLAAFIETRNNSIAFNKKLPALLNHLANIGEKKLGFKPVAEVDVGNRNSKQHPIIPTRLYLNYFNRFTEELDELEDALKVIDEYLPLFADRFYGKTKGRQKVEGVGGQAYYRPTMKDIIEQAGIEPYINKNGIKISKKQCFSAFLRTAQFMLKCIIHLYTGMRDQEVARLPYLCVHEEEITPPKVNEDGDEVIPARMIRLLSTTTKFEGYENEESWFAPKEALRAVHLLQRITDGLAPLYGLSAEECPLFTNPSVIHRNNNTIPIVGELSNCEPNWFKDMVITKEDFDVLQASDDARNFFEEPKFQVGQVWPLNSHQFRRSLAFYATNSGFVSLPTLKRQFKHLSQEMTKYYRRGFENIRSIFGYYDPETGEFNLPDSHIAFEVQVAMPMHAAEALLHDIFGSDTVLFGKSGSYLEKRRNALKEHEILIEDVRADTIKRMKRGELAYRETLLGGCTNTENCDCVILGEFTSCLGSACAVIKVENIESEIEKLKIELAKYDKKDGEYQILESELNDLLDFKKFRVRGDK
ncbi:hypothetical protein [Vibrio diabolicus]|uniref:hypothetical protein n=1 Tax=Vibrio diabolicus TaxID=50719 RepID=UPI0021513063|nr:hypothetical protein [Vibrio diabolicus]MCE9828894.1 hypothetical protein [Vibrio diabolicus]